MTTYKVSSAGMIQADLEEAIDQGLEQIRELYNIGVFGKVNWR